MATTDTAVTQDGITIRDEYEHLKNCLLQAEQSFGIYCKITADERICDSTVHLMCHDYISYGLRAGAAGIRPVVERFAEAPYAAKVWLLICMDVFRAEQCSYACFAPLEAALAKSAGIEVFNDSDYYWNDDESATARKRSVLQVVLAEAVASRRFDNMDHKDVVAYIVSYELDQIASNLKDGSVSMAELIRELKGEYD